jgi:predicted nucleotide-binding protein (sugar kinase/HSP70/actin superfamily)
MTSAVVGAIAVAVTPETVEAAYTIEIDVFAQHGIQYLHLLVNLSDRKLFVRQMFRCWGPCWAFRKKRRNAPPMLATGRGKIVGLPSAKRTLEVLDIPERENRLGVVTLGRPFHHDPGLTHGILEEFQKLGYPVFSQNTLPLDEVLLESLFGD